MDAFFKRFRQLDEAYDAAGIVNRFSLGKKVDNGPLKFHSRQYPSPSPLNKDVVDVGYVFAKKVNKSDETDGTTRNKGEVQMKLVPVPGISELEDDWVQWDHPNRPKDPDGTNNDTRLVERIEDVQKTDKPYQDTSRLFSRGMKLLSKSAKQKWEPGQLLGNNCDTQDSISLSSSFIPPGAVSDVRSTTSSGHVHKYRRPLQVGVGWGDYDAFNEWQSYGRHIDSEMVEKKKWEVTSNKGLVIFESGSTVKDSFMTSLSSEYSSKGKAQPLCDLVKAKRETRGRPAPTGAGQSRRPQQPSTDLDALGTW